MDTKLPSEKAKAKAAEKQRIEDEREQARERLAGAIARVSNSKDGQIFLQWLAAECGWCEPFLALNPQTTEVNRDLTVYQAMRINLWQKIRKHIPWKQLREIEDV